MKFQGHNMNRRMHTCTDKPNPICLPNFYGVYISQLICFASSHVTYFNNRNKFLTAKLLSKAIGIINSAKNFPNLT